MNACGKAEICTAGEQTLRIKWKALGLSPGVRRAPAARARHNRGKERVPPQAGGRCGPTTIMAALRVTRRVLPQGHTAVSLALLAGSRGLTSPRGSGAAAAPSGRVQREGPGQVLATSGADKQRFPDDVLNILPKGAHICF